MWLGRDYTGECPKVVDKHDWFFAHLLTHGGREKYIQSAGKHRMPFMLLMLFLELCMMSHHYVAILTYVPGSWDSNHITQT